MKVVAACLVFTAFCFAALLHITSYPVELPAAGMPNIQQPEPYRVPDAEGSAHYHRPDNGSCSLDEKDHPCDCMARPDCSKEPQTGEDGTPIEPSPGARCQNWCHPNKCGCGKCI